MNQKTEYTSERQFEIFCQLRTNYVLWRDSTVIISQIFH